MVVLSKFASMAVMAASLLSATSWAQNVVDEVDYGEFSKLLLN